VLGSHTCCTQIPTDLTAGARKREVDKAARTDQGESVANMPDSEQTPRFEPINSEA